MKGMDTNRLAQNELNSTMVKLGDLTYKGALPAEPGAIQHTQANVWNQIEVLDATDSNAVSKTYTWGLDLSGQLQGAGGIGGLLLPQKSQRTQKRLITRLMMLMVTSRNMLKATAQSRHIMSTVPSAK